MTLVSWKIKVKYFFCFGHFLVQPGLCFFKVKMVNINLILRGFYFDE